MKMKIVVIGAVKSAGIIINALIDAGNPPELVFSLDESVAGNISAYCKLHEMAEKNNIKYIKYKHINDEANIQAIKKAAPDYIFAVGFSQLICDEILDIPKFGVIGLHPAPLPKYRGRAAVVWQMLLGIQDSMVTMFIMDKGMDSGPIIGQEPYHIGDYSYAEDVLNNSDAALERLVPRVIDEMLMGRLIGTPQDEEQASYLLMRTPKDGIVDWTKPGLEILRFVRAISRPYPGAFSFYDGQKKIIFWRVDFVKDSKYIGFPGQIAYFSDDVIGVVCVDGILEISEYQADEECKFRVGHKFVSC